ncbi:MAG: MarR family winged helix-turn-helix transcriptional regulator [Pseudomonadota bacterium]
MRDFDPDQSFGFNLHDAARLLRRDFERRARQHGVTRAQWSALTYLARQPGLRQSQLADLLEVTPIAVARLIDRMENEGLIERRADPDDRRAWRLHLTATASARLETLRAVGRDARDLALAGISLKDQEVLLVALKRIRDNFTTPR